MFEFAIYSCSLSSVVGLTICVILSASILQDGSGSRSKRDATIEFTVGADTNCSTKGVDTYCNGPLHPGMEYR